MRIKGAIFDVDGTLLDSMQIWGELGKRYLDSVGISAQPGLAKILFPMTLEESSAYLKRAYNLPYSVEKITADTIGILHDFYEKEAQPKNGAVDFIQTMYQKGVKLSIATAGESRILTRLLNRLGLAHCFSAILTCKELSTSKREPAIYLKAAELMGTLPCETVVFEDVLHALTTASNAGFVTVGMRSERICSLARYLMTDAMNAHMTASVQWLERTLDDSANRRISMPEGFLCADAVLRLAQNVTNGLVVNEKIIEKTVREYMPFMATENLLMEAVKRGGDRQQLHEIIRKCSMEATARMKNGEDCDLLSRLAAEPAFGLTEAEMKEVLDPSLYIGRCAEQVDVLTAKIKPLIASVNRETAEINL